MKLSQIYRDFGTYKLWTLVENNREYNREYNRSLSSALLSGVASMTDITIDQEFILIAKLITRENAQSISDRIRKLVDNAGQINTSILDSPLWLNSYFKHFGIEEKNKGEILKQLGQDEPQKRTHAGRSSLHQDVKNERGKTQASINTAKETLQAIATKRTEIEKELAKINERIRMLQNEDISSSNDLEIINNLISEAGLKQRLASFRQKLKQKLASLAGATQDYISDPQQQQLRNNNIKIAKQAIRLGIDNIKKDFVNRCESEELNPAKVMQFLSRLSTIEFDKNNTEHMTLHNTLVSLRTKLYPGRWNAAAAPAAAAPAAAAPAAAAPAAAAATPALERYNKLTGSKLEELYPDLSRETRRLIWNTIILGIKMPDYLRKQIIGKRHAKNNFPDGDAAYMPGLYKRLDADSRKDIFEIIANSEDLSN